jgi:2-polyprenyl-3-methyl-5-hydroxy-6-metoxy-1,4-benzoquinol methylase
MAERYPLKAGRYSSHSKILKIIGDGQSLSLLDVGCAQGHLMTAARDAGWTTSGIEYDEKDAEIARQCDLNVHLGSAEIKLDELEEKFDLIVIADVLEHLVNPGKVLQLMRNRLKDGGKVVISVPNIAHLSVRIQLLFGQFTRTDRGILDKTHLHFYTKKSVESLCVEAGYVITSWAVTPAPLEEVFPKIEKSLASRWITTLGDLAAKTWKSGLAYQFVVEAQPVR